MTPAHPLIRYAKSAGKSVHQIARDAGCSRMTLYRLMKGEQNATIDLLQRVSAATNGAVAASELMPTPVETAGAA